MTSGRDARIYAMWKAERKRYDYGKGWGPRPFLAMAHRFRMPIIQVKGIVAEQRQRVAEKLADEVRRKEMLCQNR